LQKIIRKEEIMKILGIFVTVLGIIAAIVGLINLSDRNIIRGDNVLFTDNYSWILALFSLMVGITLLAISKK
jgi:uncharacterized membrane protein